MTTPTYAEPRQLGSNGPLVFPLALGCMGMSGGMYGQADEKERIWTIHAALDAGINLLDTGDYYAMGHNELLIGRALENRRDRALLSVKFGVLRSPDIVPLIGARTRKQLEESLGALKVQLSPADVAQIEEAIPPSAVAGTRCDEHQMKILDSERST